MAAIQPLDISIRLDGLLAAGDPTVATKVAELGDQMIVLTARKQEILKVTGVNIDPDEIAVRLIERVHDLTAFLTSQDVETQRKALFAFCKRIVADAESREIVVETDLTGMAQEKTLPGLPTRARKDIPPSGRIASRRARSRAR